LLGEADKSKDVEHRHEHKILLTRLIGFGKQAMCMRDCAPHRVFYVAALMELGHLLRRVYAKNPKTQEKGVHKCTGRMSSAETLCAAS
jgi:hypothetical protein